MSNKVAKLFFYAGNKGVTLPILMRKLISGGILHKAWYCGQLSRFGIGVVERLENKRLLDFESYSRGQGSVDKKNGRYACLNGEPESNNPYPVGELGYAFWLEGYIHATSIVNMTEVDKKK